MNINSTVSPTIDQPSNTFAYETKTIVCLDCRNNFDFSADEQKFFSNHGFTNQPKRCPNCRVVKRMMRNGQEASLASKVNCSECNKETTVPFLPVQGKPIYCSSCFINHGGKKRRAYS